MGKPSPREKDQGKGGGQKGEDATRVRLDPKAELFVFTQILGGEILMKKALCWITVVAVMLVSLPQKAISAEICLLVSTTSGPQHILFIDVEGVTASGDFNLNGQDNCVPREPRCSPLNGDAFIFTDQQRNQFVHFGTITHGGMICPDPVTIEGILELKTLSGSGTMWHHDGNTAVGVTIGPIACPSLPPPCSPK